MTKFIADLHVHSHFSRATAKNLDIENLYIAAQLKGITVVATGDFTHPGWFSEITEKLVPAEYGLFKLKNDIAGICDQQVPPSCRRPVRFILETEISNIYKKDGKTRKNHNLVFVPDFAIAAAFNARLDAIGNIKSDGRPILGLDAKHLLEILLETSDEGFLIPAHIWTPWFSMLGSKSGFDSVEECFEDLTPHIFAAETGLSSDPPMNRKVSDLDRLTLVSNSDAHSPLNLGREANLFNTVLSYSGLKTSLETGDPKQFLGTFEFYPEEGKYHLDGHRKCEVCFTPQESIANDGICPVCGRPLTLGVLYRVSQLSDRPGGMPTRKMHPFHSIVPLAEILSEIFSVGPKSKKVQRSYRAVLEILGPEFDILHRLSKEQIDQANIPLLGEAVMRMRQKKVHIFPGYDGEYGKIKIFKPGELNQRQRQYTLFSTALNVPSKRTSNRSAQKIQTEPSPQKDSPASSLKKTLIEVIADIPADQAAIPDSDITAVRMPEISQNDSPEKVGETTEESLYTGGLNPDQSKVVRHKGGPLIIAAGPGTGKTRTLTHRIAYLIDTQNILPENILAVTFTHKAASEMVDRIKRRVAGKAIPCIATFHSLCLKLLQDFGEISISNKNAGTEDKQSQDVCVIDDTDREYFVSEAVKQVKAGGTSLCLKPAEFMNLISCAKQKILSCHDNLESLVQGKVDDTAVAAKQLAAVYSAYQQLLITQGLHDFEDLIFEVVKRFENDSVLCRRYQNLFKYIFVDEYQDVNEGQYRLIRALAPAGSNLCVIGDPDQSIYAFRGSDVGFFMRFTEDYPGAEMMTLTQNYRSTETILEASHQVIRKQALHIDRKTAFSDLNEEIEARVHSGIEGIKTIGFVTSVSEKSEAVAIGKTIEQLMGGMEFHSADFGKVDGSDISPDYGFSDFAVLYRTRSQAQVIADVFQKAGIPYQIVSRENAFSTKGIAELIALLKLIDGFASYADLAKIVRMERFRINPAAFNRFETWCRHHHLTVRTALASIENYDDAANEEEAAAWRGIADQIKSWQTSSDALTVEAKLGRIADVLKLESVFERHQESREVFETLMRMAGQFDKMSDFMSSMALHTDTDLYRHDIQKVALMTMHAAKGLEFPVVFIAGCEKDYLPFKPVGHGAADMDEERRLFYVAMTRARDRLYLTRATCRTLYGKKIEREISPFIDAIARRLIKDEKKNLPPKSIRKKSARQLELF